MSAIIYWQNPCKLPMIFRRIKTYMLAFSGSFSRTCPEGISFKFFVCFISLGSAPKRKNFDIQRNTRVGLGCQFTSNRLSCHHNFYVTEACLANLPEVDLLPWICPTTEIIWLRRPIVELRLGRRPSIGWRMRRPILKMFLIFSETIAEAWLPWSPAVELRLGHCSIEQRLGHYSIEPRLREYSIVLRLGHYPNVPSSRLRRPTIETLVPLQELCQLRHLPRLLHELLLEA